MPFSLQNSATATVGSESPGRNSAPRCCTSQYLGAATPSDGLIAIPHMRVQETLATPAATQSASRSEVRAPAASAGAADSTSGS